MAFYVAFTRQFLFQRWYSLRRIGNQIFLPFGFEKVGYESIVGLEVSSLEGSFFSVQVTRNGRDFSDTGILFQYGRIN